MSQLQSYTDEHGRTVFDFGTGAPVKPAPGCAYYSKEVLFAEEKRRKEAAALEREQQRMNALEAPTTQLFGVENTGAVRTSFPVAETPKRRHRRRNPKSDNNNENGSSSNNNSSMDIDTTGALNGNAGTSLFDTPVCLPQNI